MINALLLQALRERASDLHFEPYEARSVVRFRVDGVLRDVIEPPRALHAALVSRLKIMASLDIAEKRLPQDGRIALKLGDKQVDVRVSTLPTGPGERVVLRLLDKDAARLDLTALGMSEATRDGDRPADPRAARHRARHRARPARARRPRSTPRCRACRAARVNMMTVEDPIEYALDGVGQTQVNPRIELDFARALRAILRQDPDVIMIGEIRDLETAQIAVQASLTGHLVLATLHTNDARQRGDAAGRHGRRAVSAGVEPARRARAAAGAHAVPGVPRAARADAGRSSSCCAELGLPPTQPLVDAPRLRAVQRHRLSRPHRRLRAAVRSTTRSAARSTTARPSSRCGRPQRAAGMRRCAATARAGSPMARRRSPSCCA